LVLSSEGHGSNTAALHGIESVRTNALAARVDDQSGGS
jgi:uncharacterized protein YegP (UPF0339 family)